MEWDSAVSVSHADKFNGATDFHFVSPYRKGRSNPIAKMRAVSDEIHGELNQMRREREAPRIATMPEVRFRNKKKAGITPLVEQLAAVVDLEPSNLRAKVEALGHTVTRFNEEKGTISVIHIGKKKGHRYSIESLLMEAQALRSLGTIPLPIVEDGTPDMD
jgi:hypothetical protein